MGMSSLGNFGRKAIQFFQGPLYVCVEGFLDRAESKGRSTATHPLAITSKAPRRKTRRTNGGLLLNNDLQMDVQMMDDLAHV